MKEEKRCGLAYFVVTKIFPSKIKPNIKPKKEGEDKKREIKKLPDLRAWRVSTVSGGLWHNDRSLSSA